MEDELRTTMWTILLLVTGLGGCTVSTSEAEVDRATRVVDQLIGAAAVDPTGAWVTYAHDQDIWIRPLAEPGQAINLTGVPEHDPFAAEDVAVPPARRAQPGWEYDPTWSPDGRSLAIVAARADGDDDSGNDRDLDIWLIDFGDLDWTRVAAENLRRQAPQQIDETGASGVFWDDCPAPPEDQAEPAADRTARLASCVRRIRPPAYYQLTNDPGIETDPRWIQRRGVVFRSDKGGLWYVDVPPHG